AARRPRRPRASASARPACCSRGRAWRQFWWRGPCGSSTRAFHSVAAAVLEDRHGGKRLAFEEFEKCAASGRYVADPIRHTEFVDGRDRVTAAGERERG